ncbi:MAG: hypothetical protein V3U72_02255 [Candidatus Aenigmarchaeota archaeon]
MNHKAEKLVTSLGQQSKSYENQLKSDYPITDATIPPIFAPLLLVAGYRCVIKPVFKPIFSILGEIKERKKKDTVSMEYFRESKMRENLKVLDAGGVTDDAEKTWKRYSV